jgi:hypothetical protein
MGTLDLVLDPARLNALLVEATRWSDRITLCLSAPHSEHGGIPAWMELLDARKKYERVIIHRAADTEAWLLQRLHETGALRLAEGAGKRFTSQLLGFRRDDEVRLFLVHAPLARAALESDCGSVAHFHGHLSSDFALSSQRLTEEWQKHSRVPTGSELDALAVAGRDRSALPPVLGGSHMMVLSDTREVAEQVAVLVRALRADASMAGTADRSPSEEPEEGQSLSLTGAAGVMFRFTTLAGGFRLELDDGHRNEHPVVLQLEVGAGLTSSSALLLREAEGRVSLAWRGGLLGASRRRNATLWAQSRLHTLELSDPALERHERVGVVAHLDGDVGSQLGAFASEVRRLRELLGTQECRAARPELTEFSSLDEEEQIRLIGAQLLGLGGLPLDEAVSAAAQGLRGDGYVQYQRLRRDGALYQLLEERIGRAARRGVVFDRPSPGRVRAIQPELDDFGREDWLDCLVNAIPASKVLDRSTAQRLVFDYAREIWGLSAQRLRSGGKTERALKSTLNSAIRRGLLRRVGAAYLERVAPGTSASSLDDAAPIGEIEGHRTAEPLTSASEDVASTQNSDGPNAPGVVIASGDGAMPGPPDPAVPASPGIGGGTPGPGQVDTAESASGPLESSEQAGAPALQQGEPSASLVGSLPSPAAAFEGDAPLDRLLSELSLPIRTANWADRKGMHALRDLVAWHPDAFGAEPNVGRLTVAETRVVVESLLGREWEEAWVELDEPKTHPPRSPASDPDVDSGPLPCAEQSRWNRRKADLSAAHLALPLSRLGLPARMRAYCEQHGLSTVGELVAVPRDHLLSQPNLGRASLVQTLEVLDAAIEEFEQPVQDDGLMSGWRRLVQRLPALQRMILVRRSGISGQRETLESLGETLGLTRERVRQIEARCLEEIQNRSALIRALQQRLSQAFAGGRCVPLTLLVEGDPWWAGIEQQLQWADYVFERLLGGGVYRLELEQQGRAMTFFARFAETELRDTQQWLLAEASRVPTPCGLADYEAILEEATRRLDPAIRDVLQALLEEQLCFDEADPERVLGFGNTKPDQVLAMLASQPHPIPVGQVFEALGRCRLPDEVLYFRRGVIGLERHFPEFQRWSEQLVPACLALMAELPAGRQWMVIDLHEALQESGAVPDWLGHWHLASLLRRSGRLDYLGRLRVALPSSGQRQQRIHLEDAVLTVLREAKSPLPFEAIARHVREQTDIRDATLSLMLISSPFVQLGEDAYGLIERDVPGGPDAIARGVEAVLERLERDQRGLTTYQAFRLAQAQVAPLVWSQHIVTSLLRSEPQLRLSRSGQVGLASWDDVRAPTRGEFIRQQVEKAGGRLERAALDGALLETYGRVPADAELDAECQRHQLRLVPNAVIYPETFIGSQPATLAIDVDLSGRVKGIPAAARQHFDELLLAPADPESVLLERARAHLQDIEDAGRHNEFIDVALARRLVELFERLLAHVAPLSPTTQRIARAAVLYFISTADAEDDFELSGLDDDQAVLDAILKHLELDWS